MKSLSFILGFLTAVSCFANCTPVTGYTYCYTITINGYAGASTLSNYPLAFSGTYAGGAALADLRTVGNGGQVQNSNGYDIVFTSDAAGVTAIACEQESYSASTGAVAYWIKVASLSGTSTTVYISFGNSGISTAQCALHNTNVWTNYVSVYHCELSSGNYGSGEGDSRGANNLGADSNVTAAAGIAGGSCVFPGTSNNNLQTSTLAGTPTTGTRTLELWFKHSGNFSGSFEALGGWGQGGNSGAAWDIQGGPISATNSILWVGGSGGYGYHSFTPDSNFHYLGWVLPAGQTTIAGGLGYLDGAVQTLTFVSGGTTVNTDTNQLCMGDNTGFCLSGNIQYTGSIDEMRISATPFSADYFAAVYKNINTPSSFYTLSNNAVIGTAWILN